MTRRAYLVSVINGRLGFARSHRTINLHDGDSGDAPIVVLVGPQAVDRAA